MTVTNLHPPEPPDDDGLALPPHDMEAEMAVLGALMMAGEEGLMLPPDVQAECMSLLSAESFLRPAHQAIFAAIRELTAEGKPCDGITVRAALEKMGRALPDPLYLHTLLASVPVTSNAAHYARRLVDCQSQRDCDGLSTTVRRIAADPSLTPRERLNMISTELDQLTEAGPRSETATAADLIGPLLDALEAGPSTVSGIPSGWGDVDRLIPGFRSGEVTVIGGRPGMGKSVILLNIAAHAAIHLGRHVLAVTLEMSRDEYMERLLAAEAGVDLSHIRERKLTDYDWDRIQHIHGQIADAQTLHIHEGPDMSPSGIRAELRSMRRAGTPAELVVIDYLQLMETAARQESRQIEVSGFSRSVKMMAREFGVPVLIGSQLNRAPDLRTDHHPQMSDLRESGAVENDADIVILLYRDDHYVADSPSAGEIVLDVAKNRQGAKGFATLAFRGQFASCGNLYRDSGWTPTSVLGGGQ